MPDCRPYSPLPIGKESFALVEETGETHCEDNRDGNLKPQNSVHDYIDERFHETLIKLIKKEVTKQIYTSQIIK